MIRILLALVVCACTEHIQLGTGDAAPPLPGLVSLQIAPATTALAITDLSQPPQTVAYTAQGTFADGGSRDVTQLVAWTVDNPAPGGFVMPGAYRTSSGAAGRVTVTATSGQVAATAALTVAVTLTIVDDVFPPPAGADSLFDSGLPVVSGDPMHSPAIVYPAAQTMFPQGLARILFQYKTGMANDSFRLAFDSDLLHVVVFTGSDRWQPDDDLWRLLEQSSGGGSLAFAVTALDSAQPTTIYANPPISLAFAAAQPDGAVAFFSAATNGVMRGTLGATSASKLFPPASDTTCVGCHAIARSGAAMAFGYGGPTLETIALPSLAVQIPAMPARPTGWAAWSPSGDRLLVATRGMLALYDATGNALGGAPLPGMLATHPDWSPDGRSVVVSLATMIDPMDMDMKGGKIATLSYAADVFGAPQVLVDSTGDNDNNYFPRWSPDGSAIAYIHASSSSHAAPTAELRVIAASGGTPIPLRLASHRVGTTDDVPNLADTMPTWVVATGNIQWLAFATTRPYGLIRAMPSGPSQIWLAGYDAGRGDGADPSFAAFWLPCQDITVVNNTPVWAPSAIAPNVSREARGQAEPR